MTASSELGAEFATALAGKDFDRMATLLHPEIRLRGLTPRKSWDAEGPEAVVSEVLAVWFDESRQIDEILSIESGGFADRRHVTYSFRGRRPEGPFLVEQRAYFTERDGRIDWMHVLCSGLRPTD